MRYNYCIDLYPDELEDPGSQTYLHRYYDNTDLAYLEEIELTKTLRHSYYLLTCYQISSLDQLNSSHYP